MYTVLLSGGSGKRLWPLSNDQRSKQYIKLIHKENNTIEHCSMVQRVWDQLGECGLAGNTIITASTGQVEMLKSQLGDVNIAIEPERRDTFPAVALSCAYLVSHMGASEEDVAAILPVDPYTESTYFKTVKQLEEVLLKSGADIALMGVKPSYPSEKYGYILPGGQKDGYMEVAGFKEKPDEAAAKELIREGALWNCGVFCFQIKTVLEKLKAYGVATDYETVYKNYGKLPKISFDYEVLEKAEHLVAAGFEGFWKDLGTWNALVEQMSTDTVGNVVMDDTCENTQVINELNVPVITMGAKDMVVVASLDGILVADKEESQRVKEMTKDLNMKPMYEERRWGNLKTLDCTETGEMFTLTRKIRIYDGMSSSYHYHANRDEIWTVLNGTGELILEGNKIPMKPGSAICIRKNQRHAVKAFKDFEYIEIHVGTSIWDEDINRITFNWDEIELSHIL